jgi:outer membrane lipoprotein-sorting protein
MNMKRILLLAALLLLFLSGCAAVHRSEGYVAANYHGIQVAAQWKVEVLK